MQNTSTVAWSRGSHVGRIDTNSTPARVVHHKKMPAMESADSATVAASTAAKRWAENVNAAGGTMGINTSPSSGIGSAGTIANAANTADAIKAAVLNRRLSMVGDVR